MQMINTEITVDPLGTYKGIKHGKLLAATGMIPYFIQEAALSDPLDATEAFHMLVESYGFGGTDMLPEGKGKVLKDGTFTYPEDPDLAPMVSFIIQGQKDEIEILVFQYGYVVVRDLANTHMVRMD